MTYTTDKSPRWITPAPIPVRLCSKQFSIRRQHCYEPLLHQAECYIGCKIHGYVEGREGQQVGLHLPSEVLSRCDKAIGFEFLSISMGPKEPMARPARLSNLKRIRWFYRCLDRSCWLETVFFYNVKPFSSTAQTNFCTARF